MACFITWPCSMASPGTQPGAPRQQIYLQIQIVISQKPFIRLTSDLGHKSSGRHDLSRRDVRWRHQARRLGRIDSNWYPENTNRHISGTIYPIDLRFSRNVLSVMPYHVTMSDGVTMNSAWRARQQIYIKIKIIISPKWYIRLTSDFGRTFRGLCLSGDHVRWRNQARRLRRPASQCKVKIQIDISE